LHDKDDIFSDSAPRRLPQSQLHLTVPNSRHSIFNSLPSASSVAHNPSGEILICREDEDLLFNKPEENKMVPKQFKRIVSPARSLSGIVFCQGQFSGLQG